MHSSSFFVFLHLSTVFAAAISKRQDEDDDVPSVYIPLIYRYGLNKVPSTLVRSPGSNDVLEVVFDHGTDSFWIVGPDTTVSFGEDCNDKVPVPWDYTASESSPVTTGHDFEYIYGPGVNVSGFTTVNDTMAFSSINGTVYLTPVRVAVPSNITTNAADDDCQIAVEEYYSSIMGAAPFMSSTWYNTSVPSIRQDLLEAGLIDVPVQSMWMDKATEAFEGTFTGGALFGGIDTSKFTGELTQVVTAGSFMHKPAYMVLVDRVSINGATFGDDTGPWRCKINSGAEKDSLPFLPTLGYLPWLPSECQDIPANQTIDFEFVTDLDDEDENLVISVPLRNYARGSTSEKREGYCFLNIDNSLRDCQLGAPFLTAAFFAADDERNEIALAQGGVSAPGSEVDKDSIIARIP